MTATEIIRARRSIRKYKRGTIPREHLKMILEAAMMAPSACNTRPWEFVVVTDPTVKQQLADSHPYARHLGQAYAAIIVCGRPDLQENVCPGYFPQDCGAAVQNILLQAADLGYGTCWCGVYPREERMNAVARVLAIKNAVPFALITLGVPDEAPAPRGFYDESRVRWLVKQEGAAMELTQSARRLCDFLSAQPEVRSCRLYGSLSTASWDQYSDIDIEIDVSGVDNSLYLTRLPEILRQTFPVVFSDYAPSLAPEKYVVTLAIDETNPFRMVDIACAATPHCRTLSRQDLSALNQPRDHLLKLFSANLKHHLRGADCQRDIAQMYARVFASSSPLPDAFHMLCAVHAHLTAEVKEPLRRRWLEACAPFLESAKNLEQT